MAFHFDIGVQKLSYYPDPTDAAISYAQRIDELEAELEMPKIEQAVRDLIARKAIHAKNGVTMGEEKWSDITNHMSKELNEFEEAVTRYTSSVEGLEKAQATHSHYYEVVSQRHVEYHKAHMLEELGDIYGLLAHMVIKAGYTIRQVEERELLKLKERFPDDSVCTQSLPPSSKRIEE